MGLFYTFESRGSMGVQPVCWRFYFLSRKRAMEYFLKMSHSVFYLLIALLPLPCFGAEQTIPLFKETPPAIFLACGTLDAAKKQRESTSRFLSLSDYEKRIDYAVDGCVSGRISVVPPSIEEMDIPPSRDKTGVTELHYYRANIRVEEGVRKGKYFNVIVQMSTEYVAALKAHGYLSNQK